LRSGENPGSMPLDSFIEMANEVIRNGVLYQ
jgi:hypothetical protein